MIDDSELLRRYAEEKSEAAFAGLVQRHVNFVYACALRRVGGDAHLAKDVTQHVFTALARDAAVLARREVLSGWLFTTARNAAAQVVRAERRRHVRETEAQIMNELTSSSAHDAEWERLRPVIDDALDCLSDDDRQAVLLRFFEGKSFADVGAKLRLSENSARMRVERVLDKLHALLARRGVTSTTGALALALANQAGVAAPVGLAASVTGAALAGTAGAAGGWAVTIMSISKLQMGIVGALAVAGAAGYVMQARTNAELRSEIMAVQAPLETVAALRSENRQLAVNVAEVEMLRRDDAELKQLEQRVEEIKQTKASDARLAQARAAGRRQQLEAWLGARNLAANQEADRLNREGNKLVEEYKAIAEQAKKAELTPEGRAQFEAAAKVKLEEIRAKQAAVQALIAKTREELAQTPEYIELRSIAPEWQAPSTPGRLELRRSPPSGGGSNGAPPVSVPGEIKFVPRP